MNVADVISRVTRQFGDESTVQVTNDDIFRWINDAQRQIVMQNEGVLEDVALIDLLGGTDEYTLPTDLLILRVLRVRDTDTQPYESLQWKSLGEFDTIIDGWDGNTYEAKPQFYTTYMGKFYLFPKPSTSFTQGIKVIYSRTPTDVINSADPLGLPIVYHNAIVSYCLAQAYEMDEDAEMAVMKNQQFQTDVNTNAYKETWGSREFYPSITVREEDLW